MPVVNSSSQSETVFCAQQLAVIRQYLSSVDTGSVSALQGDGSEGVRFLEAVRELCSDNVVHVPLPLVHAAVGALRVSEPLSFLSADMKLRHRDTELALSAAARAAEAASTSMSTRQPVSETSSWVARFLSLSKEERQFVIRVGLNGSGKYAASPCSGSDGRGLWFRAEDLGLIVCEGSYKWSAPGFAEGIESLAAISDVRTPGSLP